MSEHWSLEYMPGPTEAAKALQVKQHAIRDAMYTVLNRARKQFESYPSYAELLEVPEVAAIVAQYDQSVAALTELLGESAPCWMVDIDLWSSFNDFYKEVYGFRPHGVTFSRAEVKTWMKQASENVA